MCGAVALCVAKFSSVGVRLIQAEQHIPHYIGVGVLVYSYSRRCMRAKNHAQSVPHAALCERLNETLGYIGEALLFCA